MRSSAALARRDVVPRDGGLLRTARIRAHWTSWRRRSRRSVRFLKVDEPTPHPHILGDRDLAIWALACGNPEVTLQTCCSAPEGCAERIPVNDHPISMLRPATSRWVGFQPSFFRQRSLSIARNTEEIDMAAGLEKSIKRTIRRNQLREMVPLADSTIYEMEQRGEFPRRFALSPRCVVWDLSEVEAWLASRRSAPIHRAQHPDVTQRRSRPVKAPGRALRAASTVE